MQKLSEEKLLARDAKRDLNAELLESIEALAKVTSQAKLTSI